jgi:putative Mn2+ efflux pump MntP
MAGSIQKMPKWMIWIGAGIAGIGAWLIRSFFAERTEKKLTTERDAALVDAESAAITARAKSWEADKIRDQQKREDAIHAQDTAGLGNDLDNMFK